MLADGAQAAVLTQGKTSFFVEFPHSGIGWGHG
jgi:hypothetical protein